MLIQKSLYSLFAAVTLVTTALPSVAAAAPANKAKPFLIQSKLPHLTMMVKMMWNDPDLALTPKQKEQLLIIRKRTISGAQKLNKEIQALEKSIVEKSALGVAPEKLKDDVYKLAKLRAEATMLHFECIYDTRKILTQDQRDILE